MKKFKIFKNESLNSFLDYSFRYKWSMLGVIALSAVTSMAGAVPAWLSKYLIDDVFVNKNYLPLSFSRAVIITFPAL